MLTDLQAAAGVRLEVSLQVFEIEAAGGVLADLTEDSGGCQQRVMENQRQEWVNDIFYGDAKTRSPVER